MPDKGNNILKYNPGEKFMKIANIVYGDFECIPEEISTCSNDPEKSLTIKISKDTLSGFSFFSHCSFDTTKNKFDYYRVKNCMKVFCKFLK